MIVSSSFGKIILNFEGLDGAVTTIDETGRHSSFTFRGSAQIDTAQKKFGNSSLYLPDVSSTVLKIPITSDFRLTAFTDYTISFFIRHTTGNQDEEYIKIGDEAAGKSYLLNQSSNGIRFCIIDNTYSFSSSSSKIVDTNWHHIVIAKKGTNYGVYLDGTQIGFMTSTKNPDVVNYPGEGLMIGATSVGQRFRGHIDSLFFEANNTFSANPNVNNTDEITVPTTAPVYTQTYVLTTSSSNGTVTKNPNTSYYLEDSEVILTPVPSTGYRFSSWSGDIVSSANPLTVTMDADKSITANFLKNGKPPLPYMVPNMRMAKVSNTNSNKYKLDYFKMKYFLDFS